MKKLQFDLISIVVLALLAIGFVLIWGQRVGVDTPEERQLWISVITISALILAAIASMDRFFRWRDALHTLGKWLRLRKSEMAGTTQASVLTEGKRQERTAPPLESLRQTLRQEFGLHWRYKLPWLLLTGDDRAISRLMPELADQRWLVTGDAVLLWSTSTKDGLSEVAWLKQIYKLRRRRSIDAIVLVTDGDTDLSAQGRALPYNVTLAQIAEVLRWSASVYVLDVADTDETSNGNTPVFTCELPKKADSTLIGAALDDLRGRLAQMSIGQVIRNGRDRYTGMLSRRLDTRGSALAQWAGALVGGRHRHVPVRGIAFAPYPLAKESHAKANSSINLPLWHYLSEAARLYSGRRVGWHPITVATYMVLTAVGLWTTGMLISGISNARDIELAQQTIQNIQSAPNAAARLRALLALQQQIERYEHRTEHHAPLATRFGLNRDPEVLAALWKPYANASRELLSTPVQQDLEASLVDLGQLQVASLDDRTSEWALGGHATLKAYLMLTDPSRVEPAFLARQLAQHWSTEARITPGEKLDARRASVQVLRRPSQVSPRLAPRVPAGTRQRCAPDPAGCDRRAQRAGHCI